MPLFFFIIFFFLGLRKITSETFIYKLSLFFATFSFISTILLLFFIKKDLFIFQLIWEFKVSPLLQQGWLVFGLDFISLSLILLTNLIIYLCILSIRFLEIHSKYTLTELLTKLFFINWGLNCAFSCLDLLGFFIFFEATLLPIFFIILQGGSRERKIRASYLIALYTIFGSIFMLFNIIYLFNKYGTTNYLILSTMEISFTDQLILWGTFFFAFAAKIPVFPFHIWLPEAHVEAPTIGSVLLAALLLKLGIYGMIRFGLVLFPEGQEFFKHLIVILTICSFFYTNLTAIRQVDIKKIIAYSSVVHMNLIVLGILCISIESLDGAIYQMLAHGIVSGALFFCIGILYERFKSRFLWYFGGAIFILPFFGFFFFMFILANISFPMTCNFIGEMLLFIGIFKDNFLIGIFAGLSMFWGVIYNIWTYNRICFGNLKMQYYFNSKTLIYQKNFFDLNNNNSFLNFKKNYKFNQKFYVWLIPFFNFINNIYKILNNFFFKYFKFNYSKISIDIDKKDYYILSILFFILIISGLNSNFLLEYISLNDLYIIQNVILKLETVSNFNFFINLKC